MNAAELGIRIGELEPGPHDAITDVAGVRVGHTTLIEGESVRTGVTVILPTPDGEPCFAGAHRLNGNGELTGPRVDPRVGPADDSRRPHEHVLRRRRPRRDRRRAARGQPRTLAPARRRRDLRRLPERHRGHARSRRARVRRARARRGRPGRARRRRRRHRDDLPRVQGRHRHRLATDGGRAHGGRSRPGEPRAAAAALGGRRSRSDGSSRTSRCRGRAATRRTARSSSWSRPTPRSSRTSASGSPSARRWGSRGRAARARTRAATSRSPSPRQPGCGARSRRFRRERGDRPALLRHDRGDGGGDRQRVAERRDDDGARAAPCTHCLTIGSLL